MKFLPFMYQQSIFDIDYKKLKELGIKCLIFDLDNTLALVDEGLCTPKVRKLISKLKKEFKVLIISNNFKKRVSVYAKDLDVDFISFAMKPSNKGFREVVRKYKFKKEEMVMIGDQMMTDVLAGNRFQIKTILVDALGKKDLKLTSLNRNLENRVIKNYTKKGIFERGKYYG